MKVGDTFRVFEVVKPGLGFEACLEKTGIEESYVENLEYPHRLNLINCNSVFRSSEIKQVGTIRIKSLKNGK